MNKQFFILNGIILFYVIQRISELVISNENEKWLATENEAVEVDPKESLRMRLFHFSWFVSLTVEANLKHEFQPSWISIGLYCLLASGMAIRLHTMEKLKQFWTIKVLSMKNQNISNHGLYKYFRHPNYAVVVMELICIPLLMKAYFTMTFFSIINIFILSRRIELEESTLMKQSNYKDIFYSSKMLVVGLLMFGAYSAHSADLKFSHSTFNEAKSAQSFIKFKSESTKLGFITTSFEGYIKEIKGQYALEGNTLKHLEAFIPVGSIDTDNNSRNEKLYKQILEDSKFPTITAQIAAPVTLKSGEQIAEMIFTIKDKKIQKPVKFNVENKDGHFVITGHTSLGLKEMGLPDPSISVAKVRDMFDFDFNVIL